MTRIIRVFCPALLAITGLVGSSLPARADEECEKRIHQAEDKLRDAVQSHGEDSKEARKRRHELEEAKRKCPLTPPPGKPDAEAGATPTARQTSPIPSSFLGKWVAVTQAERDQELVVTVDSISWKRKDEGQETFSSDKLKLVNDGQLIAFDATEIAYWNYATGEKPRRAIQVAITPVGGQLRMTITGGQTLAPGQYQGTAVAITTPPKECLFRRK